MPQVYLTILDMINVFLFMKEISILNLVLYRKTIIYSESKGSFYTGNWLILANFDTNFVIPEISVNQVRKDLACILGVLAGFS